MSRIRVGGMIMLLGICVSVGPSTIRGAHDPSKVTPGDAARNWSDILGPSQATLPPPQDKIVWRDDVSAALREAAQTGRPVFVTMRCLPCKQCSAFDKDVL